MNNLSNLEYLMQTNIETLQGKFEKHFDIENISTQLEELQLAKFTMETVFHDRKMLCLGPFVMKIQKIHKFLKEKYSSLMQFFKEILSTTASNEVVLIEQQEDEIMSIIEHQPKNLEELHELKIFLSVHLQERLLYIDTHSKACFDCLSTMEDYEMYINENILYRA